MINNPSIQELEPFDLKDEIPPINPYRFDGMRMGEAFGKNIEVMYSHHASEERDYVILVDKMTGRRWRINFNNSEKLTDMEFRLLNAEWPLNLTRNKTWRAGQGLMNTLFNIRPDLYKKLTGTMADPFNFNERIGSAMRVICTDEQYERLAPTFKEK